MKPNRFLTVPSSPRYVDEEGGGVGQIPELRIPKLLKTSRFLSFLEAKNEDGSWVWLKPEVKEGDAVNQDSILQEMIAKPRDEERDRLQFECDLKAARDESSGKIAFELHGIYAQRKIQIDGELAAQKFLEIAIGKQWPEAIERNKLDQAERKMRSGFVELDLSTVERVCREVRLFVRSGEGAGLTLDGFVNHWFEHKEEWGRFCNGFERAAYNEGEATCNVIMYGVENYSLLGSNEKDMFMKYLGAVASAATSYKGRGDDGAEVDLFVKMLRDVCAR